MPDSLLKEISFGLNDPEREKKLILASKLVESGRISTGRAAHWVGIPKPRFLQEIGRYGVSAITLDEQAFNEDIANARNGV